MEPRQIIRSGIAASAVVHLSFVAMLVVLSDVHPFASVAPDSVAVDIVTPDQVKEQLPEPPPKPEGQDLFDLSSKAAAPASAPPAAASTPAVPQSVAKSSPATPQQQQQAAVPQTNAAPGSISSPLPASNRRQPAAQSAPQAQPAVPTPAFTPAQPDLSVQYHVLLGLPQARPGDGFDAAATEKADVGSSPIAEFRRPSQDVFDVAQGNRSLRQGGRQASCLDVTRWSACRGARFDRGQCVDEGAVADAKRDQRPAIVSALHHVAAG